MSAARPLFANVARGLALTCGSLIVVGAAAAEDGPIEDNSFLIEEAYNQEAGVVQHISTLELADDGGDWSFSFTQEWPAPSRRHQLSYTVPIDRSGRERGVGDVAFNYRYQLLGEEGGPVAFAPRLSLLLPSGDEGRGLGSGALGLELNLPWSAELDPRLVGHANFGASYTSNARGEGGGEADVSGVRMGASLVYLARPTFNLMLEAVWASDEAVAGDDLARREESLFVSPGLRFAINLPSGLQIVPGVAVPIGVGPSDGERSLFLYLSFEHPFG